MKIFQNIRFNVGLIIVFLLSLFLVYFFGECIGIASIEKPLLVTNALLMLMATMIGISLPLYASYINEKERKELAIQKTVGAVALYVGNEIIDNVIEIQDIINSIQKSEKQLGEKGEIQIKNKNKAVAAIWKAASDELVSSLEDKHHRSMVMSGLVAEIKEEVRKSIRETYQKMDNLIKRLRRVSSFLGMALSPPSNLPPSFIDNQLNVKLPESIKAINSDIEIFNNQAEKTRVAINILLEPYGQQIKVFPYEDDQN